MATGGSLMGKADATLVQAAFREGSSNVQKDLSDVYTKREEAFKTFQEGISTIFKNLGEEKRENDKKIKEGTEWMNTKTSTWDAILDIDSQVSLDFKEDLKNATTDLEKRKIWAKYNNYAEMSGLNKGIMENVIDLGVTGQLLFKAGSKEQETLIQIIDDYNNNTDKTNPAYSDKKGDIVYTNTSDSTQLTLSEIQRAYGRKDSTAVTDIGKMITDATKNENNQPYEDSENGSIPGFKNDLYNKIYRRLSTTNDIINAGQEVHLGMTYSVEDMLSGKGPNNPLTLELFEMLETLDMDKDGTPGTTADATWVTSKNATELGKAIMDDDDLYKEVIARAITNTSGKRAYDINQINKEEEDEDPWWKKQGFNNIMQARQYQDYLKLQANKENSNYIPLGKSKNSLIFVGGGNDYLSEERKNQLDNYGSTIAIKAPFEGLKIDNKNAVIAWDDNIKAYQVQYADNTKGHIYENKKELIEALFLEGESKNGEWVGEEFANGYFKSQAYQSITDWTKKNLK